ncbi:Arabinan endo-1,5-alpha-L-arabinosidase precursor [Sphingobacterium mizutaii]|uniref:Arabinan endo-1,5-alpha-L-arabinosidase n=2 Tax=Sphingobacterium mizutaii TaxID=1010 RepID=A0AAJ4XCN0_9SPHI|nr:Glycosyl hydrolases family 43 [Sphingobacterium mizutaii]SNV51691.1 Arabinan endo-1,5-alpha-L-arabinosidase precursor [Sphingobacterium mizutaii]
MIGFDLFAILQLINTNLMNYGLTFQRILVALFLIVAVFNSTSLLAQNQARIVGDFADPSVISANGKYYAVGTSSEWAPHLPIYTSTNLLEWKQVGFVFEKTPDWIASSFWAPEYFYQDGTYYVYYSAKRKSDGVSCIGVATSKFPDRGFVDQGIVVDYGTESIDAFVVRDGKDLYMTWKAYGLDKRPIELLGSKLSADGLKLEGEPFSILQDTAKIGIEGQSFIKKDGYYYMFYSAGACCGPGCDYHVQAVRSKTIRGPYEDVGESVLLGSNERWKCMGHGTFVTDKKGDYYYLFHGYSQNGTVFTGRQGLLAKLEWSDQDKPVFDFIKNDDKDSESSFRLDFRKIKRNEVFGQWDFRNSIPNFQVNTTGLLLSPAQIKGNEVGSVLTWRPANKKYAISAKLDLIHSDKDLMKGIVIYGDKDRAIGLAAQGNQLIVWQVNGEEWKVLSSQEIQGDTKAIELRLQTEADLSCKALFKVQNGTWTNIEIKDSSSFNLKELAPWDRSPRPGLQVKGGPNEKAVFTELSLDY